MVLEPVRQHLCLLHNSTWLASVQAQTSSRCCRPLAHRRGDSKCWPPTVLIKTPGSCPMWSLVLLTLTSNAKRCSAFWKWTILHTLPYFRHGGRRHPAVLSKQLSCGVAAQASAHSGVLFDRLTVFMLRSPRQPQVKSAPRICESRFADNLAQLETQAGDQQMQQAELMKQMLGRLAAQTAKKTV